MKDFIKQIGWKKGILLLAAGVVLLLTSIPEKNENTNTTEQSKTTDQENEITVMEERLKTALEKVEGVGRVKVMITVKSSGESIVNKDTPYEREETSGGEDTKIAVHKEEETVLVEEDGNRVPYVIKQLEPEIEGVIVVAEGGKDTVVKQEITEAVMALFDVSAHKVKILKMEDGS